MYISILDYNRQSVVIINDTENVTAGMQTDDVEMMLNALGFHGSEISFMVTDCNPYEQVSDYVSLRELCEDADQSELETIQHILNKSSEE